MNFVAKPLSKVVAERARDRCEFCVMTNKLQNGGFEVDHIHPRSRGGATSLENTALICPHCNIQKSDHGDGIDPVTAETVSLFHPRQQTWHDHFEWSVDSPFLLLGKTPCGRATVARLKMNDLELLYLRRRLAQVGFDCTKSDFV